MGSNGSNSKGVVAVTLSSNGLGLERALEAFERGTYQRMYSTLWSRQRVEDPQGRTRCRRNKWLRGHDFQQVEEKSGSSVARVRGRRWLVAKVK